MDDTELVIAARAGDRTALDELVRRYLPLVYNLAWRAMGGDADVDDVVQDIMVRALRQLPGLREPHSFRPWLAAIAMHQVSTHLARRTAAERQVTGLEEAAGRPDPAAAIEDVTLLRAELAGQRRQLRHAGQWLAPDDRALLGLWWLESAGRLGRTDVAKALGVNAAHTAVRLQRMRDQLEVSRSVVAALEAVPGCDRLGAVIASWDGVPSPFWRKRIARHVRTCVRCTRAAEGMVPAERLLAGMVLLPVPALLTAAAVTKAGLVGKATAVGAAWTGTGSAGGLKGWLLGLLQATATHPIAAAVTAGTVALGVTVTTTGLSAGAPSGSGSQRRITGSAAAPPLVRSSPLVSTGALRAGTASLESSGGGFLTVDGDVAALAPVGAGSDPAARRRATFEVVPGLADPACFSFRAADGRYLRHSSWRLRVAPNAGSTLFRGDATFCDRPGAAAGSISLESSNYHGRFLRRLGTALWVEPDDGTAAFRADRTFVVRPPLG